MSQTAIIIPYRDRAAHLAEFIQHMDGKLVYVIEQTDGKPFNRAKLLNIGADIAFKDGATHIITHDVDMIPVKVDYTPTDCAHLATQCSQFQYRMPYSRYFGGVNIYSREVFEKVNGYSNNYWGWGAEDDDMLLRCEKAGVKIERRNCIFESLAHKSNLEPLTHQSNCEYLRSGYDYSKDGLNTLDYSIVLEHDAGTHRIITVDI
jgi:predicted glycosyltransferase involved in capsule biosynthesis